MKSPKPILDSSGAELQIGDNVSFLYAPEELIRGLPLKDQSAIIDQVGNNLEVQNFDEYGHVELEFTDLSGNIHYIWIKGLALKKTE